MGGDRRAGVAAGLVALGAAVVASAGGSAGSEAVADFPEEVPVAAGDVRTDRLARLVNDAKAALGDDLTAVVLYGSAAGRDYHASGGGADAMLLVRAAGMRTLDALAPVVAAWCQAKNPPPLVLTEAEWRRRADVFAIEYADLLERHRVVHGTLPLDGVQVRPRDLRIQLESEITGKLLRFRRAVMTAGASPDRIRALLLDSLPTMLALLRATLHLHGQAAPESSDDVCTRAGTLAGFDPSGFRAVLASRRGQSSLADTSLSTLAAAYLESLEALLHHVDGVAVSDHPLQFPLTSEVS